MTATARVTLPMARAILTDHSEATALDASAANKWHEGVLSPRQRVGFYEIRPERYAYAMGLYRARVKLIERVAKWRRANPAPATHHVRLSGPLGIKYRVGGLSQPWADYRLAVYDYEHLTKSKKAKTEYPSVPAGDWYEEAHDTSWQRYHGGGRARLDECRLCELYQSILETWAARRRVSMAHLGVDVGNISYHGQPSTQWPDGSWSTDVNYSPLPIRSSRAVKRNNITKEDSE